MMINYEDVIQMSPNDLIALGLLEPLAKKAKLYADIIQQTYLFHANEDKIVIFDDNNNREYFTHTGIWQARYLNQSYDVACDAATIFQHMAAHCLITNNLVPDRDEWRNYTPESQLSFVYRYFHKFIRDTVEKYNECHPDAKIDMD